MIHELKIEPVFMEAIIRGEKTFEVRYNDRGYQKGDILKFQRYAGEYLVTYVLSGWGLKEDYVCLGIRQIKSSEADNE